MINPGRQRAIRARSSLLGTENRIGRGTENMLRDLAAHRCTDEGMMPGNEHSLSSGPGRTEAEMRGCCAEKLRMGGAKHFRYRQQHFANKHLMADGPGEVQMPSGPAEMLRDRSAFGPQWSCAHWTSLRWRTGIGHAGALSSPRGDNMAVCQNPAKMPNWQHNRSCQECGLQPEVNYG